MLSQDMTRQMLQPGMNDHGLGPSISGDRFGHGGSNAGFRCQLTAFIEGGRGVVVMTNSDAGGRLAQELLITIFEEYDWDGIAPDEKVVVTLEPAQYEALVGRYRLEGDEVVEISYVDGKLVATLPDTSQTLELLAESDTEFFVRTDGRPVRFVRENGRVTEVMVGGGLRGRKID
ncbi:MAG: DUF3471 domain-containing protein [Gemmatimonadetes bacterium]|nr:DUF3471 domain-containing protein [Gemmatimonadota bacterium]